MYIYNHIYIVYAYHLIFDFRMSGSLCFRHPRFHRSHAVLAARALSAVLGLRAAASGEGRASEAGGGA
jgi:hypothetical protein